MADDDFTTLSRENLRALKEIKVVLRELREDVTSLSERLDGVEARLASSRRQSRKKPPESPQ